MDAREMTAKELKNHTGAALRAVAAGEKVLITSRGRPVAWIVPIEEQTPGQSVRPFDEAWASIDAALAGSQPYHETWEQAESATRRRSG